MAQRWRPTALKALECRAARRDFVVRSISRQRCRPLGVPIMNIAKAPTPMVAGLIIGVWIGGCAAPERQAHPLASQPVGHPMQCRMCYDIAVRVLTGPPKHKRYKVVQRHQCSDCRTNVIVYTEAGEMKIKCSRCAPEGVPCDRCLPPDDSVGSTGTASEGLPDLD